MMGLNKSTGNMYEWINYTYNTIKGLCPHLCSYCYCKRWGTQKPIRFDEKELKTDLGKGNFIFVGSSCDMFAKDIPDEWIKRTLEYCGIFDNRYLFQTKNPKKVKCYLDELPENSVICTTIESNFYIKDHMGISPTPMSRAMAMRDLAKEGFKTYVTIEPIMEFDLKEMTFFIKACLPEQVNIGADSSYNNLPEPSAGEIKLLISELEEFTIVKKKKNLDRLFNWTI